MFDKRLIKILIFPFARLLYSSFFLQKEQVWIIRRKQKYMYCIGILIFPQQIFRLMKALKKEFIICCNHKSMHNTCKYLFVEALELIKVFAASFNCLQREKEYFSQIFICNFKSLHKLFYSQIHKGFTFSLKNSPLMVLLFQK